MTIRRIIELTTVALALMTAAMALHAWIATRDEQQRLATTISQQKQLLDAADDRERTRQSALDQTLAQIASLKRATQTPQQIVSAIPRFIQLPQPITLTPNQQGIANPGAKLTPPSAGQEDGAKPTAPIDGTPAAHSPDTALPSTPSAQIPTADLKPLFDYIQDCRACQLQLAAAKQNSADDADKIAALTKQRDAAITAAKGGTVWRRLRRNALWFAAGAAALAATHHTKRTPQKPLDFRE